ncbi:eIF2 kinase Gcn2p negative regulator [Drechslerella dactyloides]|uniref:EIF2 kinase Gcn2p negative regulator n=1 Tax=Drechslerella dactyloides TaxID=74499 RepID=A0AAD6J026_DREDA|nr:eIF2 kinase Gcn2p negative regulator [Drechslerella dactyloides]
MSEAEVPQDLLDEITSLNSIYSPDTLTLQEPPGGAASVDAGNAGDATVCILSPPASAINPPVSLIIRFPKDYPASRPVVVSGTTFGKGLSKEEVTQLARDVLQNVWLDDSVVLFDFVEGLKELLHKDPHTPEHAAVDPAGRDKNASPPLSPTQGRETVVEIIPTRAPQTVVSSIQWNVTPPTTVQKSVFVGRSVRVTSAETAKMHISDLISGDRKIARATHNITAYRIRGSDGIVYQDNDDDGETAAGSRLGHLLELIDVWGVLVVVSRWYGGVKLGPDRFRIINQVAREALVLGNFIDEHGNTKNEEAADGGKNSKKKKGRHH